MRTGRMPRGYFGTASDYPVLKIDVDLDGDVDQDDYEAQEPGPKSPRVTAVSVSGITQTGGDGHGQRRPSERQHDLHAIQGRFGTDVA